MSKPRVLLADDHTIVAEGLRSLLEGEFEFVGTVGDGRALLDAAQKLKPDVIVADISMPLLNGLDAARHLKRAGATAKIIFLTMHAEAQFAAEAFRAGASGYLLKSSAGEELITAIHEVVKGRAYVTPLITRDVLSFLMGAAKGPEQPAVKLTPRQREVLQLIAEGRTMKEVASILNISARTVESHKYEMMEAIGVQTNAELVQYAIKIGLVTISLPPNHSAQ
ncbi:MAG TPA: response regulator transcription factor [Blastocatellia bacterium]|jgi:DNA-binding NarL/FixJ family response regulator|nr:response regulator transcription factor [Blastocatellia bacterium]